ncbi:MAG: cytochrome-c oxidase, cbb3-type subunit III [Xanthomonadales bacterium]|nr:cytochrome-c oxidase, cbb3-type subunit III [Xanthomonadales bacterium]
MSAFWTWYIAALVIINLVGCVLLIYYTGRKRPGDAKPEDTSHIWDGDLTEYNKPMPKWWINLFYITIVFTVGYLVYYPGVGAFAGVSGWSSASQHDAEKAESEARLAPLFAQFADVPIPQLVNDPKALSLGQSVFANNCAMCHGSDARGSRGFPNLTDTAWNWGGSPEAILTTVLNGRQAAMPAFGAVLGSDQAITETAVYVQSLSGMKVDPALAAAGKARFEGVCAACHGVEGKGNEMLGAPNLTDDAWLYGSDLPTLREGIVKGRNGMMPPHGPIIGNDRARLVAAYVYSLSQGQGQQLSER